MMIDTSKLQDVVNVADGMITVVEANDEPLQPRPVSINTAATSYWWGCKIDYGR